MKQREFIHGGIKLIGFWLLATGAITLIWRITECAIDLNSIRHNPRVSISGLFSLSQNGGTTQESLGDYRMIAQWSEALWRAIYAFLQVVFALYLCRGGGAVVRFLAPINDEEPSKSSEAASKPC